MQRVRTTAGNAGIKSLVGAVGDKSGKGGGGGSGDGGGRGRCGGREVRGIGVLIQEDNVATDYQYVIDPSDHIAHVMCWKSTTQL